MENDNIQITDWTPSSMLEVTLNEPDDFLKIRETLTRIGVASRKDQKLYQSCHILHKQGRYFIVHFKELFLLDGKPSNLLENDIHRRNTISTLLADWGLISIVNPDLAKEIAPLRQIKVIPFKEKSQWELCPKYNIGNTQNKEWKANNKRIKKLKTYTKKQNDRRSINSIRISSNVYSWFTYWYIYTNYLKVAIKLL